MIVAALVVLGYAAMIAQFGLPALLVACAHVGVMMLARW